MSALKTLPESWCFNFRSIDREHQALLDQLEQLRDTFGAAESRPYLRLHSVLSELRSGMLAHFESEEAEMASASYPGLSAHAEQHRQAVRQFDETVRRVSAAGKAEQRDLHAVIEILIDDILRADIPFKTHLYASGALR